MNEAEGVFDAVVAGVGGWLHSHWSGGLVGRVGVGLVGQEMVAAAQRRTS